MVIKGYEVPPPPEGLTRWPESKSVALRAGTKYFFSGKPCVNGHIGLRYTRNNYCVVCSREKKKEWDKNNPEQKKQHRKDYKKRNAKKISKRRKQWRDMHPEEVRARAKAYYDSHQDECIERSKRYRFANHDDVQITARAWTLANPEYMKIYREVNKEHLSQQAKNRYASGAGKEYRDKYRRLRQLGTFRAPDLQEHLEAVYALCRQMTELTGIKHYVDHVIPIVSDAVCGLHVPWNLRVVTAGCNLEKGGQMPLLIETVVSRT